MRNAEQKHPLFIYTQLISKKFFDCSIESTSDILSKKKTVLLILLVAAIGYFARPRINPSLPWAKAEKPIPELGKIYEPTVQKGMMGSKLMQTSQDRFSV